MSIFFINLKFILDYLLKAFKKYFDMKSRDNLFKLSVEIYKNR